MTEFKYFLLRHQNDMNKTSDFFITVGKIYNSALTSKIILFCVFFFVYT